MIRGVKETDKAQKQKEQVDTQDEPPRKKGEPKVKIFTREDVAEAGVRMRMREIKHPDSLSTKDMKGSQTRLGRYEFPESTCIRPIGWGVGRTFPAHIAEFNPKSRVPRRLIAIPDYSAIMDQCQKLRHFQEDNFVSSQEYFYTENRIHEVDHARRLKEAVQKWLEERERDGKEHKEPEEIENSEDDDC